MGRKKKVPEIPQLPSEEAPKESQEDLTDDMGSMRLNSRQSSSSFDGRIVIEGLIFQEDDDVFVPSNAIFVRGDTKTQMKKVDTKLTSLQDDAEKNGCITFRFSATTEISRESKISHSLNKIVGLDNKVKSKKYFTTEEKEQKKKWNEERQKLYKEAKELKEKKKVRKDDDESDDDAPAARGGVKKRKSD